MSIRNPEQRVGVFVDVQNLYYSARNLYNARVKFNEVLDAAVGDRKLVRAIAYVVQADMPEEHTFFEALEKCLHEIGFLNEQNPQRVMSTVRQILSRGTLEERDVQILRGILRQWSWYAEKIKRRDISEA